MEAVRREASVQVDPDAVAVRRRNMNRSGERDDGHASRFDTRLGNDPEGHLVSAGEERRPLAGRRDGAHATLPSSVRVSHSTVTSMAGLEFIVRFS
jgi:hypothetical protein